MLKRHDLLWLNDAGREAALRTARPFLADATADQVATLLRRKEIPAIVSRQEERHEGHLAAGFASPEKYDGARLRVAVLADLDKVEQTMTPFQVAEQIADADTPPRRSLLEALLNAGEHSGIAVGFFGSTALQTVTGLPYCDETSDVDVYIKKNNADANLQTFHAAVLDLERESGIRIDVEYEYREIYGIKLKEIFAGRKLVLAKGLYSVELFPSSSVL